MARRPPPKKQLKYGVVYPAKGFANPAKRIDREGPVQITIVEFLELAIPEAIVHHCQNEVKRSGKSFAKMIAAAIKLGMKKGFPDLLVALPDGRTIYFEVKVPKDPITGAAATYARPEQKALHQRMQDMGHLVAVVRSIDDVKAALDGWGIPYRNIR